jgi:hypothetical protein
MSQYPLPPIQPGSPLHPQVPVFVPKEPRRKHNVWAIVSIVCGLLVFVPYVTSAIAVVAGLVGIRTARDERYTGRGLAVAGLLLGVMGLVAWGLGGRSLTTTVWDAARGRSVEEPRRVAYAFLEQLGVNDLPAARANAGPLVTPDQVARWAEQVQEWGPVKDVNAFRWNLETHAGVSLATFQGTADFGGGGTRAFEMSLVKQGPVWKVTDVTFPE